MTPGTFCPGTRERPPTRVPSPPTLNPDLFPLLSRSYLVGNLIRNPFQPRRGRHHPFYLIYSDGYLDSNVREVWEVSQG